MTRPGEPRPDVPAPAAGNAAGMPRYHSLDRLRVVAMLLGLVLHSSVHYFVLPVPELQAYLDRNTSPLLELLVIAIHSYRMPVFFVMAGFFAAFVHDTRGARTFLRHRWSRVGVPLLFGLPILFPLASLCTYYAQLWTAGPKMTGVDIGVIIDGLFMHLWFLYYLLLFSFAAVGAAFLVSRLPERFRRATLDAVGRMLHRPVTPVLLAMPTAFILLQMELWTLDYSSSPFPPPRLLSLYGLFFTVGWFIFERRDVLRGFETHAWTRLLAGAFFFAVYRYFGVSEGGGDEAARDHLMAIVFLALSMWMVIYGTLGLFLRYLDSPSAGWRYLSDAAYWMYLIHLPITIALGPVLADVDVIAEVKFLFVFAGTTLISLVTYHYLARATFIGAQLNGRKHPRVAPWRQAVAAQAGGTR